jgi:GxxExxY protein
MHAPIPAAADAVSGLIIGAAIEVHRVLGPGLLESTYENALCVELDRRAIAYVRQPSFDVRYKGEDIGRYRADLIVGGQVVVEVKSVERLTPLTDAQLLAYLRISKLRLGLAINFNAALLKDGVRRMVL